MRDVTRISKILWLIEKLWRKYPDWRFGQLFSNVLTKESGSGIPMRPSENEIFNIEDDVLEKMLKKMLGVKS